MKMTKIFITGLLAGTILLASAGSAFAQTEQPSAFGPGNGQGFGAAQDGQLSTYMQAALAQELGLTVEEVEQLLASGETHYTIALSQGYSPEEFTALMADVQAAAIELAAADGVTINQFGQSMGNAAGRNRGNAALSNPESCLDGTCPLANTGAGICRGGRR